MPKPRMKKFDLKAIGGRIRKARIDAALTIKELSEKMGVSFAYLGMVERGEKNPSDKILECVAEATGVSLDWLKNGDKDSADDKAPMLNQLQTPFYVSDIDASLFLSLVMYKAPSVSKNTIVEVLNTNQDTLEKLLKGEQGFDPAWRSPLTTLAERLKIPDILNKLHIIESFLEQVEMDRVDNLLAPALRSTLSETFGGKFTGPDKHSTDNSYVDIKESYKGTCDPVRQYAFKQTAEGSTTFWNVSIYSELYDPQVEQLVSQTKNPEDNRSKVNEALVFIEESNFEEALSYAAAFNHDSDNLPKVAIMLLDYESMSIKKCEEI